MDLACVTGYPCDLHLPGNRKGAVRLARACGGADARIPGLAARAFANGDVFHFGVVGTIGDTFAELCYADPLGVGEVRLGRLRVRGPVAFDYQCTVTLPCVVRLRGSFARPKALLVGATCDVAQPVPWQLGANLSYSELQVCTDILRAY